MRMNNNMIKYVVIKNYDKNQKYKIVTRTVKKGRYINVKQY